MNVNTKDLSAGIVLLIVGGLFAYSAAFDLPLGSARRMGPGYFPLLLASLLMVLGAVVALGSIGRAREAVQGLPWRPLFFVSMAPILFGIFVGKLGFVPTVFGAFVLTALASPRSSIPFACILGVLMTVFCTLVFIFGLDLPIPLFGPWFGQ